MRWYFTEVSICISLITSDDEHVFMSFGAIYVSSFEKCLFRSVHFFCLRFLLFWHIAAWTICIFWKLIPCWLLHLQLFSPVLWAVFSFCLWFPLLWRRFQGQLGQRPQLEMHLNLKFTSRRVYLVSLNWACCPKLPWGGEWPSPE